MVRLTKNEASMCQFMHKRKEKRAELFSQLRLLVRQGGQPFSAGSDRPAFCGVQQPQNAKVDHWEMARRTMCILCILLTISLLGPTTIEIPPQLSVNRSIRVLCTSTSTWAVVVLSSFPIRIGVGCKRDTSTFTFINLQPETSDIRHQTSSNPAVDPVPAR